MNATPNPATEAEARAISRSRESLAAFAELPAARQAALLSWIAQTLAPAPNVGRHTARELKTAFECSGYFRGPRGFFVLGDAFHGAMLTAGFAPVSPTERFWRFRYQAARCCRGVLPDGHIMRLVPCYRPVDAVTGLCSYHARVGEDYFPAISRPSDIEPWLRKHGYGKHPPLPTYLRGLPVEATQ